MSAKGLLFLALWLYVVIAVIVMLLLAITAQGAKKGQAINSEISGEEFLHALDKAALSTNLSHAGVIVLIGLSWPVLLVKGMK